MTTTAPGDVTMERGTITGLMNTGVEAQIAHEFFWSGEAMDVADCGEHAARHDRVDAADGHQSLYIRITKRSLGQALIDNAKLSCKTIDFLMVAKDHTHLIGRDRELLEELPAGFAVDAPCLRRD